jgi:hypothetical protein
MKASEVTTENSIQITDGSWHPVVNTTTSAAIPGRISLHTEAESMLYGLEDEVETR